MRTFIRSTRRQSGRPRKVRFARETMKVLYEPGDRAMVTCRFDSTARALKAQGWDECGAPPAPPAVESISVPDAPADPPEDDTVPDVPEAPQPPPASVAPPAEQRAHQALLRLPPVDFYAVIGGGAHDGQRGVLIAILQKRKGPGDAMRISALLSRISDLTVRHGEALRLLGRKGTQMLKALSLPPFAPDVLTEDAVALEAATGALEASAGEVEDPDPEVVEEAPVVEPDADPVPEAAPDVVEEPPAAAEPNGESLVVEAAEEPPGAPAPEPAVPSSLERFTGDIGAISVADLNNMLLKRDDRRLLWEYLEEYMTREVKGKSRSGAIKAISRAVAERSNHSV